MKPRIGLIVPALELGGGVPAVARFLKDTILHSDRYELKLVSLASSAKHDCSLSLARPSTWRRGAIVAHGKWEGLPVFHVGAVVGELEYRRYLPRRVLTETVANCDIVQVVCGSPAFANAVCGIGKPVSVHCATRAKVERRRRDANPTAITDWWRRFMTQATDRVDDHVLRSADAIQVMNEWMFHYVGKLNEGREVDVRYAPPGIDSRTFHPGGDRNLDRDSYVLCVGRLDDPRKNIDLLLDAYRLLPAELRRVQRLVLAGTAGPPESFWRRVESAGLGGRVKFVPRPSSEALVTLYQRASMFILPSDEEGFGVALLEAMACGIPVVSTRSGGPDGIITDGEDGYLVACGDAAMMSSRIAQLHLDERLNRAMGRRCRATVERRFSQGVAGRPFLDVWDKLLTKSARVWRCAV